MKIRLNPPFLLFITPEPCYCVSARLKTISGVILADETFSSLKPWQEIVNWANNKVNEEGEAFKIYKTINKHKTM